MPAPVSSLTTHGKKFPYNPRLASGNALLQSARLAQKHGSGRASDAQTQLVSENIATMMRQGTSRRSMAQRAAGAIHRPDFTFSRVSSYKTDDAPATPRPSNEASAHDNLMPANDSERRVRERRRIRLGQHGGQVPAVPGVRAFGGAGGGAGCLWIIVGVIVIAAVAYMCFSKSGQAGGGPTFTEGGNPFALTGTTGEATMFQNAYSQLSAF